MIETRCTKVNPSKYYKRSSIFSCKNTLYKQTFLFSLSSKYWLILFGDENLTYVMPICSIFCTNTDSCQCVRLNDIYFTGEVTVK